ncbi:MAG: DUF3822 family protein [Saprospiraceae bacterium]
MPTIANQPDLIISLSQNRVGLLLLENPEAGISEWHTSFKVDNIFLEDQIAHFIDLALLENPALMEYFTCVEIVVLDRPNFFISKRLPDSGTLGEVASKYLRLRKGDSLNTDEAVNDKVNCYTLPTETIGMFKEYYSNIGCHHLTSILWNNFSAQQSKPGQDITRLYYTIQDDSLIVLGEKNEELIYSKTFLIRDQADLFYYTIACSRMLKSQQHWLVILPGGNGKFEMPGDSILKIDGRLTLPSMQIMLSQYKVCAS